MDITNTSNVLGKDNPWIAPVDETKFAGEVAAVEHVARESVKVTGLAQKFQVGPMF